MARSAAITKIYTTTHRAAVDGRDAYVTQYRYEESMFAPRVIVHFFDDSDTVDVRLVKGHEPESGFEILREQAVDFTQSEALAFHLLDKHYATA